MASLRSRALLFCLSMPDVYNPVLDFKDLFATLASAKTISFSALALLSSKANKSVADLSLSRKLLLMSSI